MRLLTSIIVAGALGLSCALLVGCADRSALIPADLGGQLDSDLAQVAGAVQSGNCDAATVALRRLVTHANQMPASVDLSLRSRVNEGIARLTRIAPRDCGQATTTTGTTPTDTTQTTETTPSTETTNTQTTETTPTQTTTTGTTTTDTTPTTGGGTPPGQANKNGGG